MHLFSRNKYVKDERIINVQNKLYREIYYLIAGICFVSILLKYYFYGLGPVSIVTELVILLVSGVYYGIRSASLGIFSEEVELHDRSSRKPMGTKTIVGSIGFGIAIGLFFGIRSAVLYADSTSQAIFYFFLVAGVSFAIYIPFLSLVFGVSFFAAKKQSERVNKKQLIDSEDGE